MQAKSVNAGQGASWFSCGWNLFKNDFGTWFIMFLIFIGIAIVLSFVPFIGSLTLSVITPALIAGFMYSASQMEQGNSIEVGNLFQGFKDKERMNKLLALGGLSLLASILLMFVVAALLGGSAMMNVDETGAVDPQAMMTAGMGISMLLVLLVSMFVAMGFLYATPLVMLDNMAPVESVKTSFSASLKNILPLLVFGIVYFLLAIVAAIPLFLGFLILIPVSMLAMYCSYKSIFH
ncbi:MAG: BPSS1780 family membrane protein [Pseudomonadota bacterium]|nr:BPSS1780 family membrane protein [Pseudomonadota bacterium]